MKTMNEYAGVLSDKLYEQTPKAVFAAIAVSSLSCGGDNLKQAEDLLLNEWRCLHQNGIVPQKPPRIVTWNDIHGEAEPTSGKGGNLG